MVQVFKNKWRIESKSGTVIQKDITVCSIAEAEEFIKRYVSSFTPSWIYELVPLRGKK